MVLGVAQTKLQFSSTRHCCVTDHNQTIRRGLTLSALSSAAETMSLQSTPKRALTLPPDVVGAIFQFLKPAHVLDSAPTAKAWAEAGESKLVWDGLVAQTVDTAVRDTLAVGGAPSHNVKADAAVRNALERCDQKSRNWAARNPALASAKAKAWYSIGVALPPVTAAVVAEVLPYRCVISLDRRVYDCTKFVFEGSPYHHPGGSSNIRREHGRDVGRFFDIFAHSSTRCANQTSRRLAESTATPTPSTRRLFDGVASRLTRSISTQR